LRGSRIDPQVCLRLQKRQPGSAWGVLGKVKKETKRPLVTISDYSWADGKKSCRVRHVTLSTPPCPARPVLALPYRSFRRASPPEQRPTAPAVFGWTVKKGVRGASLSVSINSAPPCSSRARPALPLLPSSLRFHLPAYEGASHDSIGSVCTSQPAWSSPRGLAFARCTILSR